MEKSEHLNYMISFPISETLDVSGEKVPLKKAVHYKTRQRTHMVAKSTLLKSAGIEGDPFLVLYAGRDWEDEVRTHVEWITTAMEGGTLQYEYHDDVRLYTRRSHPACFGLLLHPDASSDCSARGLIEKANVPLIDDAMLRGAFQNIMQVYLAADVVITSIRGNALQYDLQERFPNFPISLILQRPTILIVKENSYDAQLIPYGTAPLASSKECVDGLLHNILGDGVDRTPHTRVQFNKAAPRQAALRRVLRAEIAKLSK